MGEVVGRQGWEAEERLKLPAVRDELRCFESGLTGDGLVKVGERGRSETVHLARRSYDSNPANAAVTSNAYGGVSSKRAGVQRPDVSENVLRPA